MRFHEGRNNNNNSSAYYSLVLDVNWIAKVQCWDLVSSDYLRIDTSASIWWYYIMLFRLIPSGDTYRYIYIWTLSVLLFSCQPISPEIACIIVIQPPSSEIMGDRNILYGLYKVTGRVLKCTCIKIHIYSRRKERQDARDKCDKDEKKKGRERDHLREDWVWISSVKKCGCANEASIYHVQMYKLVLVWRQLSVGYDHNCSKTGICVKLWRSIPVQ